MTNILHISDLHLGAIQEAKKEADKYRNQLETDLRNELNISQIDYLLISGDIADHAVKEEYDAALELVKGLKNSFNLEDGRIVIVPGNHDLNWDLSRSAYKEIPVDESKIVLQCDDGIYKKRFENFNKYFYKR